MNPRELRAALSLALVYMFRMLGLFMVLPVIAIAASSYPGYSTLLVGIAIGGYGLVQAALQVPMGALSDVWGRKPVIYLGLIIFGIGSVVAALADSMFALVVGRLLQGGGAVASAIMALATDVSRDRSRPYVMAVIGVAIGFSFYLAVLVGPLVTAEFGLPGVFWLSALTALIGIPVVAFVVPNPPPSLASRELMPTTGNMRRLLLAPQLWRLNANVLLLHLCITLLFVPLPKLLTQIGLELDTHWQVYLPVLVASVLGLSILMAIMRKVSQRIALLAGCLLMTFGLGFLVNIPDGLLGLLIAMILFFSGFNFLEATFPSMVSRIAPAGGKGSAMGLYACFQFSGAFFGGVIAGAILSVASSAHVFALGAMLTCAMVAITSGIRSAAKTTHVAMSAGGVVSKTDERITSLTRLDGVLDVAFSAKDRLLYLKVTDVFDLHAAHELVKGS